MAAKPWSLSTDGSIYPRVRLGAVHRNAPLDDEAAARSSPVKWRNTTNVNSSRPVTKPVTSTANFLFGQLGSSGRSGSPKITSREVPFNEFFKLIRLARFWSRFPIRPRMGVASSPCRLCATSEGASFLQPFDQLRN